MSAKAPIRMVSASFFQKQAWHMAWQQRGTHSTTYGTPLQFYSFTDIIFDMCLPENSKENKLLYIIIYNKIFFVFLHGGGEGKWNNCKTVKL